MTKVGLALLLTVGLAAGAFGRDSRSDRAGSVHTVTVTLTGDRGKVAGTIDTADFAVYRGDNKQEIVGVKSSADAPINVAVLIQEGLSQGVGHELGTIRNFIERLPEGSNVMVGYLRGTGLTVEEKFTTDTQKAAKAVRVATSSLDVGSAPFIGVKEALDKFDGIEGRNQIVLVSNGLELNRDLSDASPTRNLDLDRAISEAQKRGIPVWGIYANSSAVGRNTTLNAWGQGSLQRLADETGGKAFFAGTGFVTFDHALDSISSNLGRQYLIAFRDSGHGDLDVTIENPGVKVLHAK